MNALATALRAGVSRGATEFRNSLRTPADVTFYVVGAAIFLTVVLLNREVPVEGLDISVAVFIFPGVAALQVAFTGGYGLATVLATEREDGTLLRAKSLPNGMTGYVTGLVTRTSLETALSLAIVVIPGSLLIPGLWSNGVVAVAGLIGVTLLGLLALGPIGMAVGSIFRNPRSVGGWGFLVLGGLVVVSGLFSPLSTLPEWTHPIAQVLPLYWLGLLMRASFLPDAAVAIELGESWRLVEGLAVLGGWAIVGLVLAPVLLRRMARRESGSAIQQRREAALTRV